MSRLRWCVLLIFGSLILWSHLQLSEGKSFDQPDEDVVKSQNNVEGEELKEINPDDEKKVEEDNPDADVDDFIEQFSPDIPESMVFTHAFVGSLCIILVSEIGDKTFFIAAIMAMNHPRLIVFLGCIIALGAMHVLSALFGFVITVIPRVYTFYASTALFVLFGIKMLREAYVMKPEDAREELDEVASDLKRREEDADREGRDIRLERENLQSPSTAEQGEAIEMVSVSVIRTSDESTMINHRTQDDPEAEQLAQSPPENECGLSVKTRKKPNKLVIFCSKIFSRVFIQAFTMTFLAEWGDRSQIATVVMAAKDDVYGIIVGGLLGHFICTGIAVLGGRLIATKISVRTVTAIGGIVFILFAIGSLILGP